MRTIPPRPTPRVQLTAHTAVFLFFVAVAAIHGGAKNGTNAPLRGASVELRVENGKWKVENGGVVAVGDSTILHSTFSTLHSFRLESETTNETYTYAMPTNGMRRENWWLRGAYEDVFRLDLDGLLFPLGTNRCDSLWVYTWGMAGARLGDTSNRVVATGAPMSAVPGLSQFWSAETDGGGRLLTWQDFALNRDTNTPVSAQLELMPSGDFIARSNLVERLYCRVNPDDWDDDGIPNDDDIQPLAYDGDNFGPHQTLPEGANTNHYYWIDVVVSQANARVTFEGNGYSHLPDPTFIARAGDTNRVMLLLGKTYAMRCNMPVRIVGKEDLEVEVLETGGDLSVVWPVSLEFVTLEQMRSSGLRSHGASGGTTIAVHPERAGGGGFSWTDGFCCYYLAADGTPVFNCEGNCGCRGCFTGDITYVIGGFLMTFDGLQCSCEGGSGDDPVGEGGGYGEDDGPYAGGASATFSKSAVIFEDGYWNAPGNWVERQSTVTELHCVAHGGPNGGHVRFEVSAGAGKIEHVSGRVLPVEQDIEAGMKLDFTVGYKGKMPSAGANDIEVTTTFTENAEGAEPVSSQAQLTSVKVELEAVYVALENTNQNRHVYGVGEKVKFIVTPNLPQVAMSVNKADSTDRVTAYDTFGGELQVNAGGDVNVYTCPASGTTPDVTVSFSDAEHHPSLSVVEPMFVLTTNATGIGSFSLGDVVMGTLRTVNCVGPMTVSFRGVKMLEIPCTNAVSPTGYFNSTNYTGPLTHSWDAEAGWTKRIGEGNYWTIDDAGRSRPYANWSAGQLVWKIPIGWKRMRYDDDNIGREEDYDYALYGNHGSRPLRIGNREDVYTQKFTISPSGESSVEKFGYRLSRSRWSFSGEVIKIQ
ncbi:MAG: hypothetical protein IJG84_03110 [Kiritimatiellae bacterium]|nr:hypothetical protein [Kiritimatiellia bacterium]